MSRYLDEVCVHCALTRKQAHKKRVPCKLMRVGESGKTIVVREWGRHRWVPLREKEIVDYGNTDEEMILVRQHKNGIASVVREHFEWNRTKAPVMAAWQLHTAHSALGLSQDWCPLCQVAAGGKVLVSLSGSILVHPSQNAYSHGSCRCRSCRDLNAAKRRAQHAKQRTLDRNPNGSVGRVGWLNQAEALRYAADDIQTLHPGEEKNSVKWLRARADGIENEDPVPRR